MVLTSSSSSSSSSCASLSSLEDVSVKICSSVKFLCSYGGRIIPCYPDGRLRYIGGETRVLSVHRSISFSDLQSKLGELCGWETVNLRCQIPTEDLDALVSITSDEDLANLMEEYDLASRERQRQIKGHSLKGAVVYLAVEIHIRQSTKKSGRKADFINNNL
ncbi:hypothetical protein HPP92_023044 [Vanilla planifolia]|uniref:PB1 domain-containing protein n=1 Tax=Vanilla planifolia TaxID=51239 RepID=A0A835PWU7_VANPL|nr:hypothetical protein HPP92_023356 [Vanilla planifolia]KAG0459916.1 hypothetical protein HPP92_023044 [Vanilla planifolia]